ncbi:MAG: ribulose-phosphate 3-epimerase [Pirellulaceae bacterium]
MQIKIAPSILDCDLTQLRQSVAEVEGAGVDVHHVDVADGHFVPNIMSGPRLTEAVKKVATVPVDVHLMITDPVKYAPAFIDAGADIVLFHVEAVEDAREVIDFLHDCGVEAGVVMKPDTPAESVEPVVGEADCLMAMTVQPGFSGQSFMESGCLKIPALRNMFGSDIDIYVDGGIGPDTAGIAVEYGANVLAAASAIFNADVPPGEAVHRLRRIALEKLREGAGPADAS